MSFLLAQRRQADSDLPAGAFEDESLLFGERRKPPLQRPRRQRDGWRVPGVIIEIPFADKAAPPAAPCGRRAAIFSILADRRIC